MLESIVPTWRATHWLQLAVQGVVEDEVPWYELVIPLMMRQKVQLCHWQSASLWHGDGVLGFEGRAFARPPQLSSTLDNS